MIQGHCYSFCGIVTIYFSLLIHILASPPLHFCHHDQRDALLEFKHEFPTDASNLGSWNKRSDCCLWNGVTCDYKSGQVISLDLHETPLNASLQTNSTLFKLQYLRHLNLSNCNLHGEIPSSLGNLSYLTNLDLSANYLLGAVPTSLGNLNELRVMSLNNNSLTGNIPISFTNLTNLHFLNLDHNRFDGPIPESISKFLNLRQLYLSHNNFTGSIPRSISKLVNLKDLHLSKNKLEGEVPGFLWRLSTMMICHNSFSSFETPSHETLVQVLDLSSNSFQGPLPHWICNLKGLSLLDLSNNLFNGSIPTCLKNPIVFLLDMSLRNNSFSGSLPDIFHNATKLRSLDVSFNQLEGKFPRSLITCKALQLVNVGSNRIKDEFPSWLGSLPSLNVLSLRSNEFYGPLYRPHHVSIGFHSLRVIDISHNDFNGTLPRHYFLNWSEMTTLTQGNDDYMVNPTKSSRYMGLFPEAIYRSMEMVNKGVETRFDRIRQDFRAVDFSGNRISGKIPESVGFLKGLRLLNLSDNVFTSEIPRSLASLTSLETLDLSCNKLSGQIPQNLGDLAFLSYMNFSNNLLQGPVPRSTQFQRQNCSSFLGNSGLYGLEEICGKLHALNPTVQQGDEYSEAEEQMFSWVAAAIAYVPGVFCGLVIGHIFISYRKVWSKKTESPQVLVKHISWHSPISISRHRFLSNILFV